jgi:Zn finger protein HypA/HybF involved in hydrogenase expression
MGTIGIDNEKFFEIVNEIEIKNKCEKCGEEIEDGTIFNYCSKCFEEYVEKIEKERRYENNKS